MKPQVSPKATTKFAKATFTKTLARSSAVWLGIAGLVGAGRSETGIALYGLDELPPLDLENADNGIVPINP